MIGSKRILRALLALTLSVGMLVSSPQSITKAADNADKISVSLIGKYDSADTAAIRDIDTTRKQIRLRNHQTGKTYTLSYDNTSMMYDARGTVLSASLLEVGEIVDVTFLKSSKHITTLNVSKDAWVVENTRNHDLVRGDGTARIQGDLYRIDARTLVMAEGNLALAEDVLSTDKITVSGIGKDIYSVVVTGGHGYVSLSSDTVEDHSLVGAWLELDNEVIHKISPNMMLSAPEGDYNLQIIGNGANYQTEVNISRNQETVVDTSSVSISKPKEALVTFEIIPSDAEVFVDGQRVLTDTPQTINYGYHTLKVLADGYITQDKYLKVGTAKAVIQIELEKESDSAAESSSDATDNTINGGSATSASTLASYPVGTIDFGESSSAASKAATVSSNSSDSEKDNVNKLIKGYYIYFDKPYGAEVYFDGAYVGVVPTSINKISGNHEVILKMDGYETKSYRINVDKEEDNKSYSFPDLVKIEQESNSSSSSSASSGSSSGSDSSTIDDSSSSSDASSAEDSADSADSASTGDSSSSGDASTTEDSAPAGDSGSSADSSSEGDSSEADASTEKSSKEEEAAEDASKETSTDEGASDAANTASGEV